VRPSKGFGKCMNPSECSKAHACLHTKGKSPSDFYACSASHLRRQCTAKTYCEAMDGCRFRNSSEEEIQAILDGEGKEKIAALPFGQLIEVATYEPGVEIAAGETLTIEGDEATVTDNEGKVKKRAHVRRVPRVFSVDSATDRKQVEQAVKEALSPQSQIDRTGAVEQHLPPMPPPSTPTGKVIDLFSRKQVAGPATQPPGTEAQRIEAALGVLDSLRERVLDGTLAGFHCVGIGPDDQVWSWQSSIKRVSVLRMSGAMHWAANVLTGED
jgi:uncharacterized protein (DUF2267 family)